MNCEHCGGDHVSSSCRSVAPAMLGGSHNQGLSSSPRVGPKHAIDPWETARHQTRIRVLEDELARMRDAKRASDRRLIRTCWILVFILAAMIVALVTSVQLPGP